MATSPRSVASLLPPLTLFAFFVSAALSRVSVVVMNSAGRERKVLGRGQRLAGVSVAFVGYFSKEGLSLGQGWGQPLTVLSHGGLLAVLHAGAVAGAVVPDAFKV